MVIVRALIEGTKADIELNRNDLEAIRSGEMNYNYTIPIFMLVILGVVSIFLAFQLKRADAKQKFGLELPSGLKPE